MKNNCAKYEKWILLRQSGELPQRRLQALTEHVGQCPQCAEFEKALLLLTGQTRKLGEALRPGSAAEADVAGAARARAAAPSPALALIPRYRIVAAAAALCAAAALWIFLSIQPRQAHQQALAQAEAWNALGLYDESDLLAGPEHKPDVSPLAVASIAGAEELSELDMELLMLASWDF